MQVIESLEKIVGLSPFNTNYDFRRKHQKKYFPMLFIVLRTVCWYLINISTTFC